MGSPPMSWTHTLQISTAQPLHYLKKLIPAKPSNKPVCYDCHGIHDIKRTSDPQHGIQIKENLLSNARTVILMQRQISPMPG